MKLSRRYFLYSAAAVAAGFATLRRLNYKQEPLTDLVEKPMPADPFAVPPGFTQQVISRAGQPMDDGLLTPGIHDGMCAFPGPDGKTLLVCNHEHDAGFSYTGPFGDQNQLHAKIDQSLLYDNGYGYSPALGGTTTLLFDTRTQNREREYLSLAGTLRNCAGGPTPWGTWITCEETVQSIDSQSEQDHGYNFEVPVRAEMGLAKAVPIRAMGRFNHEAVAVHPDSGIVYQTEDRPEGLIYRFIPDHPGQLHQGGRLQALKARDAKGLDTRNWFKHRASVGDRFPVEWVDLADIDSPADELRFQGYFAAGAARFARAEGMWYGQGAVYFACTDGGFKHKGQIWRYTPSPHEGRPEESTSPGHLELFVEPTDGNIAENGDNLTTAPWGDVFVCEDNHNKSKKILRVTRQGRIIEFARNTWNHSELAGVTFSPDGTTLFVNIQFPGATVAITGPWSTLTQ